MDASERLSTLQRHPYNLQDVMAYFERRYIRNILEVTGWNLDETARLLDISRETLKGKIKKYTLDRTTSPLF